MRVHLAGLLSFKPNKKDRAELLESIESYRRGLALPIVPVTLLNHHFRRHPDPYAGKQHYLNPHPSELMLQDLV